MFIYSIVAQNALSEPVSLFLYIACAVILCLLIVIAVMIVKNRKLLNAFSNVDLKNLIPAIDKLEKNLRDEFSRNREEANANSKVNREESSNSFKTLSDSIVAKLEILTKNNDEKLTQLNEKLVNRIREIQQDLNKNTKENREEVSKSLKSFEENSSANFKEFSEILHRKFADFQQQQTEFNKQSRETINDLKETVDKQLKEIRKDNTKQITEMRNTVDEKLQTTLEKRLTESFKHVSDRLEKVHQGLGEMKDLAAGVGDLKKVLSNVKTKGILGELQLGKILEQVLPNKYHENVATKKKSNDRVEFAIKLPGQSIDSEIWLPIDSKFPLENYNLLISAYEDGDKKKIESAQKRFHKDVEESGKKISEKYIDPPNTTDFAILFLPVENMYAEVLRFPDLFELLYQKYHITVTGPTTLAAFLNSLQMGFKTLAIKKHSSEVWKVLGAVKTEFEKFTEVLKKAHTKVQGASDLLEKLRKTRSNAVRRKLKTVDFIDDKESHKLLEISEINDELDDDSDEV